MSAALPDDDTTARFRLLDLDKSRKGPHMPDFQDIKRFSLLELGDDIPAFPEYVVKFASPDGETETLVMAAFALGRAASTAEYRDACYQRGRRLATPAEYAHFHAMYPDTIGKPICVPGLGHEEADLWAADQSLLTVYL